ncbi:SbcC/MukB-like Walker B domain-containing protein [Actinoplanes sp. NPDC051411]|uniref:ATP-binding protein n=1 Tax=Actinoplanes sp. NPDC051411 TaxID=3155522 RepID=UPI003420C456
MSIDDNALIPASAFPQPAPLPADGLVRQPVFSPAPLLYVSGATEGTLQWKAETFQLVNWGGFEGRVRFDFHPGATLVSGASGTGKSTLLDAYIALMMPSDTPFNGASNDAVAGRARSAEQRNLLSYLRGQTDTTADEHGRERPKVLRGDGRSTWGAVGMTFIDDHGNRFTALRVYYAPARATQAGDIVMRMASCDGAFDLADLAEHTATQFAPKALKAAFPRLLTHDSYAAFATRLHTRLGIGANGDGAKALRLLVRIQSGHQIRTVDELYKEMVLERPATYAAADRAINHFNDLEVSYLAMQTEQQKADLLGPITGKHQQLTAARATIKQIDGFGLSSAGDTPVMLWSLLRQATLLDKAIADNGTDRERTDGKLSQAASAETLLNNELSATQAAHRQAGGERLEELATQIDQTRSRRDERRGRRQMLAEDIAYLQEPLVDKTTFERLRAAGTTFLADYPGASQALLDRREALATASFPMLERRRLITEERTSLSGRAGRVPKFLDDLRQAVARASGLPVADLPFLAELIDVAPEDARWRLAVETVLGASARILLVPEDRLEDFSEAIDPLRLQGRLTFEGVPLGQPGYADHEPGRIAAKLQFKDSPFAGWVRRHVSEPGRNAYCVESSDQLGGKGYRVTPAGQTRYGSRGSHGRNEQSYIIGFSNEDTIAAIDRELADINKALLGIDEDRKGIDAERTDLDRRRGAYEALLRATWDDLDVESLDDHLAKLEALHQEILESNDRLQALEKRIGELTDELRAQQETVFGLNQTVKALKEANGRLIEQQDDVNAELARLGREQHVTLSETQTAALDAHFVAAVAPGDPGDLEQFDTNLARLQRRLTAAFETARAQAQNAEAELERIFAAYQMTFEDPNLGRTSASYPDYALILETILTTGLHERRTEWRQRLMKWSGEDLVPLSGAMESSVQDIEDRLDPINDILHGLPFGANRDRLRIRLRRLTPELITRFRRQLRTLSSGATRELSEDQLEHRFRELQQFMGRMRRRDDPRAVPDLSERDRLLDVRRHVEVTAERYDADGQLLSTHASLGGKSGGESQELVAFIVGAALRFRLGDELRVRPRFAPVFLDEGFVKSDAEFAGRAVRAWKGLGFQLIVGAPLDKVTALEPHMDELLAITKNTTTHFSFVARISDGRDADRPETPGYASCPPLDNGWPKNSGETAGYDYSATGHE